MSDSINNLYNNPHYISYVNGISFANSHISKTVNSSRNSNTTNSNTTNMNSSTNVSIIRSDQGNKQYKDPVTK